MTQMFQWVYEYPNGMFCVWLGPTYPFIFLYKPELVEVSEFEIFYFLWHTHVTEGKLFKRHKIKMQKTMFMQYHVNVVLWQFFLEGLQDFLWKKKLNRKRQILWEGNKSVSDWCNAHLFLTLTKDHNRNTVFKIKCRITGRV